MKKEMKKLTDNFYHIISEPGDATRYDYLVFIYYDKFLFMPRESTFRFPQKLNYFEVQDIDENKLHEIAKREYCNLWTLKECIQTINELKEMIK